MADINIDGVVTWLKNWFYDKTEITGFLNNKANQSDLQTTNGNLANLSSTVDNKVDKITGKGLSTEDFTTALKDKLDGIEAQANKTTVDSALSSTSENPLQNKAINTALGGKAPTSHASSDSTYGLGSTSNYGHVKTINGLTQSSHSNGTALSAYQGKVLKDLIDTKQDSSTAFSGSYNDLTNVPSSFNPSSHSHTTEEVQIGDELLTTIGQYLGQNPTQSDVNGVIDYLLGQFGSIKAIEIVATLPTANASTMGKLYIINENSKVNVYYVKRSGADPNYTYSWHKMDTDILDELSIDWTDIENNPFSSASPSDYATSTHSHGNLTNDGKVGSSADYFVYTTTGGAITSKQKIGNITTAGAIGSTNNQVITTGNNGVLTASSYITDRQVYGTNPQGVPTLDLNSIISSIDTSLSNKGAKTDDVDWTYNDDGFTNGVKLVDKTTNANGRITLHLKS